MKAQSDRRGMEHRTMQDMIAPENPEGWTGKEVNRQARKRYSPLCRNPRTHT